ncbi:YdeI/OmpD-associated family protein [Devosia sp.]|uniref:YdeI/OmpD-associated family protein n=1 Tax=Devosia sp. TaxID=1871048 RepID=UPI003A8CF460
MPPVIVDPDKVHEFVDFDGFYAWLAEHHDSADELWIKIHKKASGRPTITPVGAIDAALCWGWIDAIRKSFDAHSFLQRYTRRGKKSIWSRVNVDNVERLIAAGLMTEHGLKHVEAARADGRWDRAYGTTAEDMPLPEPFLEAIAADPAAQATFDTLTAQNRFALAFRLHNLKTEAGRKKRMAAFVEMLSRGETIYPQKTRSPQEPS